jgi:hypothetical protein
MDEDSNRRAATLITVPRRRPLLRTRGIWLERLGRMGSPPIVSRLGLSAPAEWLPSLTAWVRISWRPWRCVVGEQRKTAPGSSNFSLPIWERMLPAQPSRSMAARLSPRGAFGTRKERRAIRAMRNVCIDRGSRLIISFWCLDPGLPRSDSSSRSCNGNSSPVRCAQVLQREFPVDQPFEHFVYMLGAPVLVVEIVGVFPNVNGQERV